MGYVDNEWKGKEIWIGKEESKRKTKTCIRSQEKARKGRYTRIGEVGEGECGDGVCG